MSDITQTLTNLIVVNMNKKRNYTEYEKQVFMYGVELILNSVLKIVVYLIVGRFLEKLKELIVAIILFGFLRKISGGKHSKTNMGCFLITGCILILSIYIPYVLDLAGILYLFISLMICAIYIKCAPMDEYYQEKGREDEKKKQKIKTVIWVSILLILGYFINEYWKMLILSICFLQAITLIENDN